MSINVVREKGVTVITMETDRESILPPLCQILKNLCYSPMCCSVTRRLILSNAISALGTIQIMVGLFNIGLGPGRISQHPGDFAHLGVAYWLGGVFILAGIASLTANRLPSACLVGFAVLLNIVGCVISVVGIVMYAIDIADFSYARFCQNDSDHNYYSDCRFLEYNFKRMMTVMDITMIVLIVLQLCTCICISVLGIKPLCNLRTEKGGSDDEIKQPLMKDVLLTSPGA